MPSAIERELASKQKYCASYRTRSGGERGLRTNGPRCSRRLYKGRRPRRRREGKKGPLLCPFSLLALAFGPPRPPKLARSLPSGGAGGGGLSKAGKGGGDGSVCVGPTSVRCGAGRGEGGGGFFSLENGGQGGDEEEASLWWLVFCLRVLCMWWGVAGGRPSRARPPARVCVGVCRFRRGVFGRAPPNGTHTDATPARAK